MRRFLQVSTRGLASVVSTTNGQRVAASLESARSLGLRLDQRRAVSLSQPFYKQRGSSPTSDGGENSKHDKSGRKKGLWEMASEKLSEVGASTRSAAKRGRDTMAQKTDGLTGEPRQGRGGSSKRSVDRLDEGMSGHDFDARAGDKSRSSKGLGSQRAGSSDWQQRDGMAGLKKGSKQSPSGAGSKARKSTTDHRAAGSVRHDQSKMRFVLDLGDNQIARIDYKPVGKGRIELYHTEVPKAMRGRGIGRALAKGTLEAASKAQLKLKVTCDYLEDYLKHHSDNKYRHLLE